MQFSMNPDPASWLKLKDGVLDYDQYPDGSFSFRVVQASAKPDAFEDYQEVTLKSTLPAAIMAAGQVVDVLRRNLHNSHITLIIQTLPDQRGDKIVKEGEGIPFSTTAKFIGAIKADVIIVNDVHSESNMKLLRAYRGESLIFENKALDCWERAIIYGRVQPPIKTGSLKVVAVDNGARERATQWASYYEHADIIFMDKKRDENGKIIGHTLTDDPNSMLEPMARDTEVWVIDDLCDGGATFISVAKTLRTAFPEWQGRLHLYVTHGLFSKGRTELLVHYDTVSALFSYDEWRTHPSGN